MDARDPIIKTMPAVTDLKDQARDALKQKLKSLVRARLGSTDDGWFPLSHGQEALWFLWKLAPDSPAYNVVLPVGVGGPLNESALRRALRILSDRHACLRMEFREDANGIRQRPRPGHAVRLEVTDAAGWDAARVDATIRARAARPFCLDEDATMDVLLLRRGALDAVLLISLPHILCDLWSLVAVMDELRDAYAAEAAGHAPALPPMAVEFEDWVRAERRQQETGAWDTHRTYWHNALAGELPVLDLPTDRGRPPVRSFAGATLTRHVATGTTQALKRFAEAQGATLFMALLAAYQVLLHRYSGQDAIMVGIPTLGRRQPGLADLVGNLVNMVPLRADLSGSPSFRQMLAQAQAGVLGALEHQDLPLSQMVDRLQTARDLSRSPIFQTTFVLQRLHRFEELQRAMLPSTDEADVPFGPLVLHPMVLAQQEGQYDLNLEMKEDERGRLVGAWKYATDLFEEATVARMADSFETLLERVVAEPDRPVAELSLLSPAATAAALAAGIGPLPAPPPADTVCALFEAQAKRRGEAIAVSMGATTLSYADLDRRADALAAGLAARGVGPGTLVAVALPRGPDFVTALVATHKAGGAFLPMDLRQSPSRLAQVLAESGAPFVLAEKALHPALAAALAQQEWAAHPPALHDPATLAGEVPPAARPAGGRPDDLAYVMYTSGSTGRPKGVMVAHRGMVNHVLAKLEDLEFGADGVLAQNAPPSFDVVVWQCLAPLAVGGRVAVVADEAAEDPSRLLEETADQGVTALQLVPSMLHAVITEAAARPAGPPPLPKLRWMVPTGEALPTDLCRRWLALYPTVPLLNTYGSTECSDDQCHDRIDRLSPADAAVAIAAIGQPIRAMTAHVLDRNLAPVPAGVVGELYIGGIGVGLGYRGDPTRTAMSFIPDPHSPTPGARLYKTRDLARRRADGRIDFLGRVDDMIKLRGLRIEPGEIETALRRHPGVAQAVVRARPHPAGDRQLVAYIVPAPGPAPDEAALRAFLAADLPQSLVPAAFVTLATLPLTANGKLDHKALPEPPWRADEAPRVPPRTPEEVKLAAIWADVLGLASVGVTDDFFAIGGDSIRSIQVSARCRAQGLAVRPGDVFLHRTVAALAALPGLTIAADSPTAPASILPLASVLVDGGLLERALQQVRFDDL
ncbi:MAG: amino acid adenylation domain-containing protein [Azospirillaceae bacterium]|nr:amino acid adenylation domain-containing protein [Azospirillaceae bacterium]